MSALGHNETAVRLAALAGDAQIALDRVTRGSSEAIDGWLAYGAALNEGRSLFPGDKEFGEWLSQWQVAIAVEPHERAAAMWAAANRDQFEEARAAGDARTVRGIHRQWKKIEADRERARRDQEAKLKAEAEKQARVEAAAAARQEAEARRAEEEAARQAAAAAKDAEERKAAQAKAEAAAEAARAAEAKAEAEEAGAAPEPAPVPDPHAAVRKALRAMTREGLEDEVIGLREENAELRAKAKALRAERDDFKARWKEATQEDMGRALGNAQRERDTIKGRIAEHMATIKRLEYRMKKVEQERDDLRAKLENQVVPL